MARPETALSDLPAELVGRVLKYLAPDEQEAVALTSKAVLLLVLRASAAGASVVITAPLLGAVRALEDAALAGNPASWSHFSLGCTLPSWSSHGGALGPLLGSVVTMRPGHFLLLESHISAIAASCPNLTAVDFAEVPITDHHITWLASGTRNRLLSLRSCRAKLLGSDTFLALSTCAQLTALELHGIDAVSMDELLPLRSLQRLQKLVLLADPALSAWVPMELQHTALPAPKSPLFDDRLCDLGPAWRHMTSLHVNEVHKVHPDSMATFLSHLVNLRDLSLVDGDCFTDVVAGSVLRHCTQLARLCIVSLQPLRLTPAGLAQLGRMTTLTHLQLQDISECQPFDLAQALGSLSQLRYLNVYPVKAEPLQSRVSLEQFFDAQEHMDISLNSIDLNRDLGRDAASFLTPIHAPPSPAFSRSRSELLAGRPAGAPLLGSSPPPLAPLRDLRNLEGLLIRLAAQSSSLGESFMSQHRHLPPLESFSSLHSLHLSHWGLLLPQDVLRLATLPRIRQVVLHSCMLDNLSLEALRYATLLQEVRLYMPTQLPEVAAGTPYSEPLVSGLAALASLSRLSTLSITGSERLTDDSLAAVAKSTAIRDLSIISCNHITAEGVARSIMRMVQLESLAMSSCRVTHGALHPIGQLSRLRRLDISQCPLLGDQAIACLTNPTTAATLRHLDISWLSLTDAALGHVRAINSLQSLRMRRARQAQVTSQGLMRLAGMSLHSLDLSGNRSTVTDEVLIHLSPTLRSCTSLDISGCVKVTSRGLQALRMMRKLCQLHGLATLPREAVLKGLHPPEKAKKAAGGESMQPNKRYRPSATEEA